MGNENFWFQSARTVRFFIFDYRIFILIIFFALHKRVYTFLILITAFIVLYILEIRRITITDLIKRIRSALAGKHIKIN